MPRKAQKAPKEERIRDLNFDLSVPPFVFFFFSLIPSSPSSFFFLVLCFRENSRLAAEVYKDMPETSFTRTISNPEVVMKRRRQQKLEKRMQEFMSSDGRPDSGTETVCCPPNSTRLVYSCIQTLFCQTQLELLSSPSSHA